MPESRLDFATPTHPLFPAEQAFIWLPGLTGEREAICTYNGEPVKRTESECVDLMVSPFPPYPVSPVTFIAWDTSSEPYYPFHPIPVAHPLSRQEMEECAARVLGMMGDDPSNREHPVRVLRNERKCFVVSALAKMGLLAGFVAEPDHRQSSETAS